MRQYRAIAKRAWPPLHSSLEPSDDISLSNSASDGVEQGSAFELSVFQSGALQGRFNACIGKLWPEIGMLHDKIALVFKDGMIRVQRCANCQPLISRGRLNPSMPKWCASKQFAVGDAVQRAAAGHGKIFLRDVLVQFIYEMEEDFLEAMLHGVRQIHGTLHDLSVRFARWAKHLDHAAGKMARQLHCSIGLDLHAFVAAQRLEKIQIKPETRIAGHKQLANLLAIPVAAIRGKAHDLAFISVFVVADELADHGVETAERVRQEHAIKHVNFASFASRHH